MAIKPNLPSLKDIVKQADNTPTKNSGIPLEKNTDGSVKNNDKATNTNTPDQIKKQQEADINTYTNAYFNAYATTGVKSDYAESFKVQSLSGIEGIPYQFLPSVDKRFDPGITNTKKQGNSNEYKLLGRKYTEKILTQVPLLFMAPCNPKFMDDNGFSDEDQNLMTQALLGAVDDVTSLIKGKGRYYSAEFAFDQYNNYLNAMLLVVAKYLGIDQEYVYVGEEWVKIEDANWANEYKTPFGRAINAANNLIFYMDSIDTINEQFANSTTQSQFASLINGFSDTAKELDYFFGSSSTSLMGSIRSSAISAGSSISSALGSVAQGLGGGIVASIADGGVKSIIDGGKIIFPDMWSDSQYSRSYSIDIKLRSPDNDSLSIFLNVLKPYCKLLCFTLPHMVENDVNTYRTPFITRAYCKGLFNVDLGMITGMSVTKGATCCWNDDGLPTQIDISLDLTDLYNSLTMTGYTKDSEAGGGIFSGPIRRAVSSVRQTANIVNNTAYMDFLANMAGLNVNQMEFGRKAKMYIDLFSNQISNFGEEKFFESFTNYGQNIISNLYSIF